MGWARDQTNKRGVGARPSEKAASTLAIESSAMRPWNLPVEYAVTATSYVNEPATYDANTPSSNASTPVLDDMNVVPTTAAPCSPTP